MSVLKFHIHPASGNVERCTATKKPCPFGGADIHFTDKNEAIKVSEERLREQQEAQLKEMEQKRKEAKEANLFKDPAGDGIYSEKLDPSIYAFESALFNSLNNFKAVKVGDTTRSVEQRMNEWRAMGRIYTDLEVLFSMPAVFKDEYGQKVYVRDYNFHKDLEALGYKKVIELEVLDRGETKHISQEFYVNREDKNTNPVTEQFILDSLERQREAYGKPGNPYTYYTEIKGQKSRTHYTPTNTFSMRYFQKGIVGQISNYFEKNNGPESRYLLSSPTRSGKSFMAAQAALKLFNDSEKKNNCAVVVSGFAEIEDEWKQTFEGHKDFNQKEYGPAERNKCGTSPCTCSSKFMYLNVEDLKLNPNAVEDAYAAGAENVVVFLTLQDLAGSTGGQKNEHFTAHDFLKKEGAVDLVISDEAHFAAFTEDGRYQEVLNGRADDADDLEKKDTVVMNDEAQKEASETLKKLGPRIGKLYITATPFNVLNEGKFFDPDSNISLMTEAEIWKEKELWDKRYITGKDNDRQPWENPCFGLPQRKNFAVGLGASPNDIFKPKDTKDGSKGFANPTIVRSVVEGMFGKDPKNNMTCPNILGNEDYQKAGMGNHIYMTLPFCASCDAMEAELTSFLKKNGLDDEYEVLNISSTNKNHVNTKMEAAEIKRHIDDSKKKTITLTVDRLGTGVTQEKWDTVIIARSMSSSQKFVQTSGRAGTPWVSTQSTWNKDKNICRNCEKNNIRSAGKFLCDSCYAKGGDSLEFEREDRIIKIVEKPNVAVIGFDPDQMVEVQYNISRALSTSNDGSQNGDDVKNTLESELSAQELYIYDPGKVEMEKVTANSIIGKVFESLKNKGVRELSEHIPVDTDSIVNDPVLYKRVDEMAAEKIKAQGALKIKPFATNDADAPKVCQAPDCNDPVRAGLSRGGNRFRLCDNHWVEYLAHSKKNNSDPEDDDSFEELNKNFNKSDDSIVKDQRKVLEAKVRNVFAMSLLAAALIDEDVNTSSELISVLKSTERGRELARHLNVDPDFLGAITKASGGNLDLDHSVSMVQDSLSGKADWNKFSLVLNSFGRFSANEVPTPGNVSDMLIDKLSMSRTDWENFKSSGNGMVDVGCKSAVNLVKFYENGIKNGLSHDDLKDRIFSVPTSPATFELTRKVYEKYGWNTDNILFHEGLSSLESLKLVELAMEKKKCRASDPSTCKYHGVGSGLTARGKIDSEVKELLGRIDFGVLKGNETLNGQRARVWKKLSGLELFDYCVSNPPYQMETKTNSDSSTAVKNIFQEFQEAGFNISSKTAMIYPGGRWFQQSGKGLKDFGKNLINNENLKSVDLYDKNESKEFFPAAALTDGTSIVLLDKSFKNNGHITINGEKVSAPGDNILPMKVEYISLVDKIRKTNSKFIKDSVSSRTLFSIESNEVETNPSDFISVKNSPLPPPSMKNPIKVLTNNKSGKAGRPEWFWMEKEKVKTGVDKIDRWKFTIKSAQFAHETTQLEKGVIVGSGEVHGRAKVTIADFGTKDEVLNFEKYMKTDFSKKLYLQSVSGGLTNICSFVPDVGDYTSNNPLFADDNSLPIGHEYKNLSLEDRLFKKFNLSDEEISLIKE